MQRAPSLPGVARAESTPSACMQGINLTGEAMYVFLADCEEPPERIGWIEVP